MGASILNASLIAPGMTTRFRQNLVRVLAVQVASILVLWLLQRHFSS